MIESTVPVGPNRIRVSHTQTAWEQCLLIVSGNSVTRSRTHNVLVVAAGHETQVSVRNSCFQLSLGLHRPSMMVGLASIHHHPLPVASSGDLPSSRLTAAHTVGKPPKISASIRFPVHSLSSCARAYRTT